MSGVDFQIELAELRVEVRHLAGAVVELKGDVPDLTSALNQARGGWKAIGAIAGLGGAVAGALTSALIKMKLGG
jgi:hypothetical protein